MTVGFRVGARAAETPRELAGEADVVITCLPTSREVEALMDGPDGLLAGLRRGALFLDCTSGDPATSRRLAARLAEREVAFADARSAAAPTARKRAPWPSWWGPSPAPSLAPGRCWRRSEIASSISARSARATPPRPSTRRCSR